MPVDSFKYLPRLIATFYQSLERQPSLPIPWTPLPRPIEQCRFALVTSGGLYLREEQAPFDLEQEKEKPTWGDPTFRILPTGIQQEQVGVSHLHVNPQPIEADFNILLPIHRFQELARLGEIGGLAERAYSFMGYQGFPPDTHYWQEQSGPQVADQMKADQVDCVLLTPS